MKHVLRKGNVHVHLTYLDGDYSNNLHASDFTVEADEKRVLFSMDFSTNQRTRSKGGNSYLDVLTLMEKHGRVRFFQIHKEKWLKDLASALANNSGAERLIEMKFLGGVSYFHRFQVTAKPNQHNVTFEFVHDQPELTNAEQGE